MLKKLGISIDWSVLGAQLACEDNTVQAEFLEAFAKELVTGCKSRHGAEMQLCWVNDELTKDAKELLHMIGFEDEKQ